MRILIAVDKIVRGAGNAAQQLAIMLSKENDVILFFDNVECESKFDLSNIQIINRGIVPSHLGNPFATILRKIRTDRGVKKQILDIKPDVIISLPNSTSIPILEAMFFTRIPIIVSERSNPFVEWKENNIVGNMRWWLSYQRANAIVYQFSCFSSFMPLKNKLGKSADIPNMIFRPDDVSRYERKDNIIRLVTLAGLQPIKRLDIMIWCFAELKKKYQNIQLVIYGEGPLRNELEQQVVDLNLTDSVFLPGNIKDTYEKLRECDIFILTSKREGFPNSMVEAMTMGVVPVSFDFHEGIAEIIENNHNGLLVKNGDENDLAEKLSQLIENADMRSRMGKEAMKVSAKYTPETVMKKWNAVIRQVTNQKRG